MPRSEDQKEFFLPFIITAYHIMVTLGEELYRDFGQCLWELVRNAVVACMPNGKWVPGVGDVEIILLNSHPLNPKAPTMVILDHGEGFTEQSLQKFCTIGPTIVERAKTNSQGTHGGAAQKRVGRFAAFALNLLCGKGDVDSGYYILTRTSRTGPVRYIKMIPSLIEKNQGPSCTFIPPDSTEMGPQRNIVGSFTAIIIPNPVFTKAEDIREALSLYIPRRPSQMFKLTVNGKRLDPPALIETSKIGTSGTSKDISVYVDMVTDEEEAVGIWLADYATGLLVAQASRLSDYLPYPVWRPDLKGVIFAPDLLANQDASRTTLSPKFLRSPAWRQFVAYLNLHVVKDLRTLLGDSDSFRPTGFDRGIMDFVALASSVYGPPDAVSAVPQWTGPTGGHGHHPPTGGPHPPRTERPKVLPVKIGDKTYTLAKRELDLRLYAQADPQSPVIYINTGTYGAMPNSAAARAEHIMLMVLSAVADTMYGANHNEAMKWVGERRTEFVARRTKKK